MKRYFRLEWAIVVLCVLAIPAIWAAKASPRPESAIAHAGKDWPQATGDLGNRRYSDALPDQHRNREKSRRRLGFRKI